MNRVPPSEDSDELLRWQRDLLRASDTYGPDAHLLLKVHGEELEAALITFDGDYLETVVIDIATMCQEMGLPSVLDS